MANINISIDELLPQAGSDSKGRKIAFIDGATKATASDTITAGGITAVVWACITDDTTGVLDPVTLSTNVITLTGATTGTVSGWFIYR